MGEGVADEACRQAILASSKLLLGCIPHPPSVPLGFLVVSWLWQDDWLLPELQMLLLLLQTTPLLALGCQQVHERGHQQQHGVSKEHTELDMCIAKSQTET